MKSPSRLLIVDDHPAIRAGVADILRGQAELTVAAAVGTGREALEFAASEQLDLAIVDMRLPDMDGCALIGELARVRPGVKTIAFSSYCLSEMVRRAISVGARGYVLKDAPPVELREAVRSVLDGRRAFSTEAALALTATPPRRELTPRETRVLACMADGLSTKEIAAALSITEGTVGVHVGHILEKLGASSRARAVALALETGLLSAGGISKKR